jgi:hypothetical protein
MRYYIAMNSPNATIPRTMPMSVQEVIVYESELGSWATKSGGSMNVLFGFDQTVLERMSNVDPHELELCPQLRLGIRTFHTSGLPVGSVGGKHFHRVKQEIIAMARGRALFVLEDVYCGRREITLDKTHRALYIPPFVMHTYTVLEPAEIIGVSNTLYDADNPATHDTYEDKSFNIMCDHFKTAVRKA